MLGRAEGRNPLWEKLWVDLELIVANAERDGVGVRLEPDIIELRALRARLDDERLPAGCSVIDEQRTGEERGPT